MYKVGNIVKLKSGGPDMTIDKVTNNKVTCVWFIGNRLKTAIFRKDTLMNSSSEIEQIPSLPDAQSVNSGKLPKNIKATKAEEAEKHKKTSKDHKGKKVKH